MKPSVPISFLAFHTKVAMVTETASVRLFSPAFDKVTSDLTLSVNLVRVMVLAVALIALSISSRLSLFRRNKYSLIQKNGYTFASVYTSKCVTVFFNQTLVH